MPTAVACPKCKTKYSLPDQLLGKPVKCKSCNTMFKVAPPAAAGAAQQPARKPAATVPQVNQAELAQMGLDGPINRQPELFGEIPPPQAGNPLGNHVVVDPGFAEIESDVGNEEPGEDPITSIFQNPALESSQPKRRVKKSGKKKKRFLYVDEDAKGPPNQIMLLVSLGVGLCFVLTIAMPMLMNIGTATRIYVYGVHLFMLILPVAISVWWIVRCWQSRTSVGNFLLILIPFWIFVYSLNRDKLPWTKEPLICWLISVLGYIPVVIAASFMGLNEQWQKFIDAGVM